MLLRIVSGLAVFVATAASTTGDFAAALEADDVCTTKDISKHGECALELAQLRASVLPSKKQLSLVQVDQTEAEEGAEDQLNEEAAQLAAKIHNAAEASAKLKQEASLLRAELQAFAEKQAAAQKAASDEGAAAAAQAASSALKLESHENAVANVEAEVERSKSADSGTEEERAENEMWAGRAEARAFEARHFVERITAAQSSRQKIDVMTTAETRRLCTPERVLNFTSAVVTHSNLGGMGPDDGVETLVYQGLAMHDGESIDMIVTASTPYMPNDALKNGVHSDNFGILNLKVNNNVNLTFRFTNSLGVPRALDPFFLTFYDIDQGMSHESRESVSVFGFDQFQVSEETELEITPLGDDAAIFQSSLRGGKVDNPKHPRFLTEVEEERTVVFTMPSTSEFQVTLSESNYADVDQGRNFLFSGPSSMVCGREHLCIDYVCPAGFHIRTMAEFLVCEGRRCEEKDRDTCCYEIPEGIEGFVPRSERESVVEALAAGE